MFFPCAAITAHTFIYHLFIPLFGVFLDHRRTIAINHTRPPCLPFTSSPPTMLTRVLLGVDAALFFLMVVRSVWHPQKRINSAPNLRSPERAGAPLDALLAMIIPRASASQPPQQVTRREEHALLRPRCCFFSTFSAPLLFLFRFCVLVLFLVLLYFFFL